MYQDPLLCTNNVSDFYDNLVLRCGVDFEALGSVYKPEVSRWTQLEVKAASSGASQLARELRELRVDLLQLNALNNSNSMAGSCGRGDIQSVKI